MRTPKLSGRSDWYPYYAAYSSGFVEDILADIGRSDLPVLDPWNGSGTTTVVARSVGQSAIGFDANPALVTIARARLLNGSSTQSLEPLAKDIAAHAADDLKRGSRGSDPLCSWFDIPSARKIRALADAISDLLVTPVETESRDAYVNRLSDLAAFYYVALFSVVRDATKQFRTTNPTWIRSTGVEPVSVDWRDLKSAFLESTATFATRLKARSDGDTAVTVSVGNAQSLGLADASVGAVVSSPPYCTRIDYVIATQPELAILGFDDAGVRDLRDRMLGTPTITPAHAAVSTASWGPAAVEFLSSVRTHTSKASATYYAKYFAQYFDQLSRSVDEIVRVKSPIAPVVLVVQDSYYKELRLDLAAVVKELILDRTTFRASHQEDFETVTLAATNPSARAYRSEFVATESVLVFQA
jgi:hypothetical protein